MFDEKKYLEDIKKKAKDQLKNNPNAILFVAGDTVIVKKEFKNCLKTEEVNRQGLTVEEA